MTSYHCQMLRNIFCYHDMQYRAHLRPQSRENGQKPVSWIINEDDFSRKKRPCNFPTLILLYHHTKFRKNSTAGNTRTAADTRTTFPGCSSTAASLKAQVSTLVPFKPSQLQPSSLHTSFTSLRLHNQTLFTFISCNMSQVQLLHFKKMAKSLPFYSFIGYFFT